MSRHKRKHHYMYMKAGGIIVAIHYGVWLVIAIAGALVMAYFHRYNHPLFIQIVDWMIAAGIVAFIGMVFVIWYLFQGSRSMPQYIEHQDHSQCAHTRERQAREREWEMQELAAYREWLGEQQQLIDQPTVPLRRVS